MELSSHQRDQQQKQFSDGQLSSKLVIDMDAATPSSRSWIFKWKWPPPVANCRKDRRRQRRREARIQVRSRAIMQDIKRKSDKFNSFISTAQNAFGTVLHGLARTMGLPLKNPSPKDADRIRPQFVTSFGNERLVFVPYLTIQSIGSTSSSSSSSSSAKDIETVPTGVHQSNYLPSRPEKTALGVFKNGLALAGHVYSLYSMSQKCLVAFQRKFKLQPQPFIPSFLHRILSSWMQQKANAKGPIFHFYLAEDDAIKNLRKWKVPDSSVDSLPLYLAYKYYKEKPTLFNFIPAENQVKIAKKLLKKMHGWKAAASFKGVPVFTARNLAIALLTSNGTRWFQPYFFDKEILDNLIHVSVEYHYEKLVHDRRSRRHNQIANDFPADMIEDDLDILESPEVQDIMEDMDEWGSVLEAVVSKAAQIYYHDFMDNIAYGNKWGRKLSGIEPSFPILVDSFQNRTAATEANIDASTSYGDKLSGLSDLGVLDSKEPPVKINEHLDASAIPKREKPINATLGHTKSREPQLTMIGVCVSGNASDSSEKALAAAIMAAERDIESTLRNGDEQLKDYGSLFIADLGGSPLLWASKLSGLPDTESTESDHD